jgi:cardiolipin synthase
VVDQHWATVGSSNIDPFSLLLAREANVMVRDTRFARELCADLQRSMQERSVPILLSEVRERTLAARLMAWLSYMLVRLLMGIAGYGKREYRSAADE